MKIITRCDELQIWRQQQLANHANTSAESNPILKTHIGFVPTMGALHAGHASLLKQARNENKIVVLSIYVNPTQFNNSQDLALYPKTIDADLKIAKDLGVDCVFMPNETQMYPDNYRYRVTESNLSQILCGAHRPGHFDGVLSIVLKLFHLVNPDRAYFGEKDYQQLELIKGMVESFFLPIQIIPCATLREQDGLAMSSRNVRLDPASRKLAPKLYETLLHATDLIQAKNELEAMGFKLDYLEELKFKTETRRFIAAHIGGVRLIDNVAYKK